MIEARGADAQRGGEVKALARREDFPILAREVNGKPLVFLDSPSSAQKPRQVLQAMAEFTTTSYANIHRGVYTLSEEATTAYERARKKIAQFINARSVREVIYTRNATESINLIARTWGGESARRRYD